MHQIQFRRDAGDGFAIRADAAGSHAAAVRSARQPPLAAAAPVWVPPVPKMDRAYFGAAGVKPPCTPSAPPVPKPPLTVWAR